jgi:hypothetical protein
MPDSNPTPSPVPLPTGTLEPSATATPTPTPTPTRSSGPSPTSQPTDVPATTDPPAAGSPTAGCVDGWTSPQPGSEAYDDGIAIVNGHLGLEGDWTLDELRYFTGPELPNVEPQYESVERWYLRGAPSADPEFRGRFLLERRTQQIAGISAVAPYSSEGYESPDWTGFIGEGPPTTYLGLPGQWSGIPYDFVTGAGDGGFPGLPAEVAGCLSGT